MEKEIDEMKHKVGVLYCGGCNQFFDRQQIYLDIAASLSEFCMFTQYSPCKKLDLILIINGCESECLLDSVDHCPKVVINNKNFKDSTSIIRNALGIEL
jgi:hypothetical protein